MVDKNFTPQAFKICVDKKTKNWCNEDGYFEDYLFS